ncbi:hypothetical protein F5Y05DRAFT_417195 [Hypoxylon sp. FL0543]|nr:hypothetical protein F5Y05DRAFT_417195 [Hypoxylon sp. FL0543]
MDKTSDDLIEDLSDKKVNQIYIWRAEVNSARNLCVCSRSTSSVMAVPPAPGASKDALPNSASSTALDSDNRPDSTRKPIDPSGPSCQPAEPANPFNPRGAPATSLALKLGCPVCTAPIDENVKLEVLRKEGEMGLVRGQVSTRSETSLNNMTECVSGHKYEPPKPTRWERVVSKPLKGLKKATSLGDEKSSGKSKSTVKGKAKAIFKPLKKLLKVSSKNTLSSNGSADEPPIRPRATEMYHAYRPGAQDAGTSRGSVETLLSALSDEERKRPGLTIDESAARLRRAQRLLDRTGRK